MNIEIFPAEKSCEQGCAVCPMARKSSPITATSIDPEVQKTFSMVESAFNHRSYHYHIFLAAASLDFFPKINYPKLVISTNFELGKVATAHKLNATHWSEDVHNLLNKTKIRPDKISLSIVPSYPIVGAEDAHLMNAFGEELTKWFFKDRCKTIEATAHSNLIPHTMYKEILPKLHEADSRHLKKVVEQNGNLYSEMKNPMFTSKYKGGEMYYCEYRSQKQGRHRVMSNRVIGQFPPDEKDSHEFNYQQAFEFMPFRKSSADFSLAPRGVMLQHSSIVINNPVLWMTHYDFRRCLAIATSRNVPKFSMRRFIMDLIMENARIYLLLKKYKKHEIADKEFMYVYEYHRMHLRREFQRVSVGKSKRRK